MRITPLITGIAALAALASLHAPAAFGHPGRRAQQNTAAGGRSDSAAVTTKEIDEGRAIFHGAGTCTTCHGEHLEGGPVAPTLREHAWKDAKDGTFPEILRVITHGVPGTLMVSHPGGISDEEATDVAAYVWAVSHGKAKP
ncbi:MAG TPA: cytochrome c [Gemmatimonadaceae bacterium]|nr:cytochrome c [Gemmatimonadaceae bacterium]